jgi:hypothetical protein
LNLVGIAAPWEAATLAHCGLAVDQKSDKMTKKKTKEKCAGPPQLHAGGAVIVAFTEVKPR